MPASPSPRPALRLLLALLVPLSACAGASPRQPGDVPGAAVDDRPTGFPAVCAPDEVEVMLLGTFHFQGSAHDAVSGTPMDMRSPTRQAQLDDVAARLARWAPQQVAVEWPLGSADSTTARYGRYLARGGTTSSANEVEQLGFRLARRLGHATVHGIDYKLSPGNDSLGALLERRADLRRQGDSILAELRARVAAEERERPGRTVAEMLRGANTDAALHGGNSWGMFQYLRAGEGENRGGPQLLARWYERNFYMAHNLTRVLRPGTRRVLVLVGSGHVPPLRNILDESPHFCPVSPLPYLR